MKPRKWLVSIGVIATLCVGINGLSGLVSGAAASEGEGSEALRRASSMPPTEFVPEPAAFPAALAFAAVVVRAAAVRAAATRVSAGALAQGIRAAAPAMRAEASSVARYAGIGPSVRHLANKYRSGSNSRSLLNGLQSGTDLEIIFDR